MTTLRLWATSLSLFLPWAFGTWRYFTAKVRRSGEMSSGLLRSRDESANNLFRNPNLPVRVKCREPRKKRNGFLLEPSKARFAGGRQTASGSPMRRNTVPLGHYEGRIHLTQASFCAFR
jgi:hypothetical protein